MKHVFDLFSRHTLKNRKAFTLAEVLITLGIIGIVAAMTMPTLMANINTKRNAAMLKQDYSILANTMRLALDSGGLGRLESGNNITYMRKWFDQTILPHIKTLNVCYDEVGCWTGNEKTLNNQRGDTYSNNKGCGQATVSFILTNGSAVCMDDFGPSDMKNKFGYETNDALSLVFYVDVNGSKLPNTYGKDIFILVFDAENDTFSTAGASLSEAAIIKDCSLTGTGRYCATYAQRHAWTLPTIGN